MGAAKKNKTIEGQTATTATKGLATGSWMRVPTTGAEVKAETNYVLYDYKYRPIRSYTTNYLGGYTYTDSKLDVFSGQLQYTIQKHKRTTGDNELVVKDTFTYTVQDRLIQHTHQINGGAEQLLAENTYDELGQLISKKVGNTSATPLQKVDYSYNIRGWMTAINSIANLNVGTDPADLFSFKLNYNTVDGNVNAANKLYNGNIAETFWSTATDGGFVRNYGYKYDNLNRLKDATYQKSGQLTGMYNENMSYDKNGNIMNLSRNGDRDEQYLPIQIDYLQYGYATNSNKLLSVADNSNNTSGFKDGNTSGDDYVYDANGNMTVDKNKNITSIVYNHLNLPTKIIFPTGNIVYFYTASGQKVQKVVTENATVTTTDYLGGYQYQNTVLQYFPTAEGYVKNTLVSGTNTYSYVFNYTDHLGNIRLSYTKNPSTNALTILDENNYYPFGLKHSPYNAIAPAQEYKYKYNGKELQDELELDVTAMDFRQYDNALGRFNSIDALSEMSFSTSPFVFARNNPVFWMDPSGLLSQEFIKSLWDNSNNSSGRTVWTNTGSSFSSDDIGNGKAGSVDNNTNEFTGFDALSEVTITRNNRGDASYLGQLQSHVYSTGKFYDIWRTKQIINKFSDLGQGLQDIGDGISVVGYALTATGVFAEVGVPLAGIGNGISLGGTVISTAAASAQLYYGNDVSKNGFKITKAFAVYGAGKVAQRYINKVPGLEPTLKNVDGEDVMNLGSQILRQNISLKIMGIDRYIDAKTDKE